MTHNRVPLSALKRFQAPDTRLAIQAPLPTFLDTLPILITIPGRGSGEAGSPPSAPRGDIHNDT